MMRKLAVLLLIILLSLLVGQPAAAQTDPAAPFQPVTGHPACAGVTLETSSTPECDAFMAVYPAPPVTQMGTDLGVVAGLSFAYFAADEVTFYASPGGRQIETLEVGYNYVTPSTITDSWVEISEGRWVKREDIKFSRASSFSGVSITGALEMPFAWVLWRHYASKTPAGETNRETGWHERYQLVNIYATANVNGWDWYLVGKDKWINQKNLSIVYPIPPASFGGNWVAVNLYEQNLVAFSGGTPVMATLVSSGVKNGQWNTHVGTFAVWSRVEAGTMNGREGYEDAYSLEMVPYAQYFDGLISLHGT